MPTDKVYIPLIAEPPGAIRVDGFCYAFSKAVPPEGKPLSIPEAFFADCDSCIKGLSQELSSSFGSSSSTIDLLIGLLLETGFNLLLEDGNIILLE